MQLANFYGSDDGNVLPAKCACVKVELSLSKGCLGCACRTTPLWDDMRLNDVRPRKNDGSLQANEQSEASSAGRTNE